VPKRKTRTPILTPRALGFLAASALALFVIGEGIQAARSDGGQLAIARWTGLGDRAHVIRLVGKQLREGLAAVSVTRDSIHETEVESGPAPVRWRVGLRPGASPIQANYAITRSLERHGGVVLSGRETWEGSTLIVRLLVGLPRRATHEVLLVRGPGADVAARDPARLSLVLFGFGDDVAVADSFFTLPRPFAVAIVAGARNSARLFYRAREREREIVMHLPLEPINYPAMNPGPGTLLVTMNAGRITGTLRRYFDQAGPVSAVANHMGSLATQDMAVMTTVYKELRRRHVPFLHVNPAAGAVCKSLAANMGVLYDEPDAVMDFEARHGDDKALDKRWSELLKTAHARGHLIVLVRATPTTLRWLPRALDAKRLGGVSLVPLSALLERPAVL
jgi:polysaccharide deacetylase 2 family uncharacterized protein YibQ